MKGADVVDALLEVPVAPSFTALGFLARSRLDHWTGLDSYDLSGRTIVVTGATSGLGLIAAETIARCGAHVVVCGRDAAKTKRVRDEIAVASGSEQLTVAVADMGELDEVRAMAATITASTRSVDVIVHNAGALNVRRRTNSVGMEATVASQVLGPFLLTSLLLPSLRANPVGRVLTMSSGGMYAAKLTVTGLQMGDREYRGSEQYARAKRAQVALNRCWAERVHRGDVVFQALHPGWADTPGVESSLPRFHRVLRPLLRTPAQGADTLIWLASDDGEPLRSSGDFWLDRRRRPVHKLAMTRCSDTAQRRAELWQWCVEHSGAEVD
jgi:dehydrogenase/reductase SDR family member 12